ncbi:MAG: hypothetical protein KGI80_05595 [Verrucomicrobiota bacterium]|nr:hypothetical protein [Verrucomicrobiota bacterium]
MIRLLFFASFFSVASLLLFRSLYITAEDRKQYAEQVEGQRSILEKSAIEDLPILLSSYGIHKELWDKEERLLFVDATLSQRELLLHKKKVTSEETYTSLCGKVQGYEFSAASGHTLGKECSAEGNLHLRFDLAGTPTDLFADAARFLPKENRVILESIPPRNVLLQQPGSLLHIPRVEIGERIEGKGTTHITVSR